MDRTIKISFWATMLVLIAGSGVWAFNMKTRAEAQAAAPDYTADVWCGKIRHIRATIHDDSCALQFPCVDFTEMRPATGPTRRRCMGGNIMIVESR